MKKIIFIITAFFFSTAIYAQQSKVISNCTIFFSVTDSSASEQNNMGSKIIYIKGKDIRVDLKSNMFSQTIFSNGNTGNVTILKTIGQSKYISNYTANEWQKENEIYNDPALSFTGNTKNILNYECKQTILKLKNGSTYSVYYTPALMPSVTENQFEFKNIPGLILEYESLTKGNEEVSYVAKKIDFNPVPALEFEIPKTGYRILH
jgi:GLPGLI family protein